MAALPRIKRFCTALLLAGVCLSFSANGQPPAPKDCHGLNPVQCLPDCSLAKTNRDCKLTIDRDRPLTPPTVQMYSGQTLTVIVKHPKPFERYILDYQPGQATLSPDVASSIVQGLLPSATKIAIRDYQTEQTQPPTPSDDPCAAKPITKTEEPVGDDVARLLTASQKCLADLAERAIPIYQKLEPLVAPDSLEPSVGLDAANESEAAKKECDAAKTDLQAYLSDAKNKKYLGEIRQCIQNVRMSEIALSNRITAIPGPSSEAGKTLKANHGPEITELANLQKVADALANDLLGYSLRIADLDGFKNGSENCANMFKPEDVIVKGDGTPGVQCIIITAKPDDASVYDKMVTRGISYSLNTFNVVSNSQQAATDPTKKKLLASVTINFADTPATPRPSEVLPRNALRWEASAGALFSSLPVRSFSAAPVFTNGTITDNTVAQNLLRPTVVPFAAANYRLSNDLPGTRWRSAIYWTGAVGVNPNTVSADFASGVSISFRALMVSALWHYGHDVRLTQGLRVGESLGAGFKGSLSTQTYWTSSFALGVGIRVPSLTGR